MAREETRKPREESEFDEKVVFVSNANLYVQFVDDEPSTAAPRPPRAAAG